MLDSGKTWEDKEAFIHYIRVFWDFSSPLTYPCKRKSVFCLTTPKYYRGATMNFSQARARVIEGLLKKKVLLL